MTLTFEIFGVEVARITLDIEHTQHELTTVVERGVKAISKEWVKRMVR